VEKALRHVAQTLLLAGYDDPRRTYGAKELDLPFQHLLKSYKGQDPAPQPQLAIPVATVERAAAHHQHPHPARTRATVDLVATAFFFLLRVLPDGTVIPTTAPLEDLLSATSVTLWLDNQKNGQRGTTIHHTACPSWFCPVKALARRVHAISVQGCPPTTPLSYVSPGVHVLAADITALIHDAARATNLITQGYDLRRVSTHSLRASGPWP
jgi:hypothetical protein